MQDDIHSPENGRMTRNREVPIIEKKIGTRATTFPYISWAAILAGLAVGLATHMLLSLFGVAAGLSAVNPDSAEPIGRVPMIVGIWNGISMLIAAFVGGYVAARASGLSRRADGVLHGFVSWGVTTLLFVFLATTTVGAVIGGVFALISDGIKSGAHGITQNASQNTYSQNQDIGMRLEEIITDTTQLTDQPQSSLTITPDVPSIGALREALAGRDNQKAMDIMINQMGFSPERATQVVSQARILLSQPTIEDEDTQEVTDEAINKLARGSWWLFSGILLSLFFGIGGGALGANAISNRRVGRDYTTM